MERKRQFYRVCHAETIAIQDVTGLLVDCCGRPRMMMSEFNQDCTICCTCRPTIPDAAVLKGRGNGIKWRMWTPPGGQVRMWTPPGGQVRMWTPPGGQVRLQNRVRGSLVRYCRMSGLLMQPLLAAGPYGVREIRSKSGMRARRPSAISWFFRSRLADRLPLPVLASLLPTSPGSFFAFHRPVRRHCEPDSPPFSWPAPRPSAPSCWRGPPRPASSACVPPSWPATDP